MNRWNLLAIGALAFATMGFLDFSRGPAAEGNELFRQGEYEKALNKYGEALVDEPESPRLNFNMGGAHYKLGNHEEAVASFARVRDVAEGENRTAKVAYNIGNSQFRLAEAQEAEDPQKALEGYALAMAAYRRALGVDPGDEDAKFNYEFARKRLEDLKKWLEEQEKKEQEQNPQNEQQPEPEEQEDQGEQQPQQQEAEDKPQPDPQQQEQARDEGDREEPEQGQQGDSAEDESERGEEMNRREAAALVDMAGDEELRPEEFTHQMHGAVVGEPAQDW